MARMSVRATFAIDPDTARSLDRLARCWRVSKSEALRRAVEAAAIVEDANAAATASAALAKLQERLGLDEEKAARWIAEIRAERRASTP